MDQAFLPLLVALSSAAAYWVASRRLGWARRGLRPALWRAVECVGAALIFLTLNFALGVAAILALRTLTGNFISLYLLADRAVIFLSLLQALVFEFWRASSTNREN